MSTNTVPQHAASISAAGSVASSTAQRDAAAGLKRNGPQTYIVLFREAPLASYRGGMGIDSPRNPRSNRVDVKGKAARDYVHYLQTRQRDHEDRLGRAIGRPLQVSLRMQHAVNGVVTVLSQDEAAQVRKQPGVMLVEGYREYETDTDVGPTLIGAKAVWAGVPSTIGTGTNKAKGEGVVVGILDSGINFGSPSFAAADPIDGYVHANPNGSGNYLGTCAAGGVDAGRCNDKLIGGYDFVCGAPANRCGVANIAEEPGFGDTNGHGSHTASTVAGNERNVTYRGVTTRISGVAPRANIIAYDICYTEISTARGLCPNVSSVAAVNQAMADGVEVINFSIGGGTSPWSDAVSLAFLNAVDAGVYVAASAGNSGPGASTLGHNEPWVASTAAAQHGRQGFDFFLSITGPVAAPPALTAVALTPGSGGVDLSSNIPGTTPVRLTPGTTPGAGIDGTSDGCAAYPAGTFAGAIAVIRRGTCSFAIKANFARDAGAIAVIIANNQAGVTTPSVPGTTIPVFLATQVASNALRDYYVANSGATGAIPYPAIVTTNTVDALGAFSSRGPAAFDVLKPDITAPGVNVLAAYAGNTITGFENAISLLSGTSMASPHQAGAAALLRQLNPTWSVPEIKSALMMTSRQSVLLEDQVTPANAFAAGAGRVQVDLATRAGLVMHETKARYLAADPGAGGDPSLLNQPSMAAARCIDFCTFTRTVRSTLSFKHQWKLSVTGLGATLSTDILTLKPGESRQITVTIDNRGHPGDGSWRFGTLVLTPHQAGHGNQALPELHMPIAVSVPPPPPPSTPLANGVPVSGLSGAAGSQAYYRLDVPAGASSLTFTLQGGTGDADLFVKRGFEPNDVIFDCVSAGGTSNETCSFTAPQAGTWFVRIVAFSAYSGVTLTGTYQ
ncbi:S8 family serine peptidase [Lysobacter niabensis]|uniref:S8 family serine peptidase n=1 Tax=Agrilutibacter niabensis TaxID=380628 RepID=UPI003607DFC3